MGENIGGDPAELAEVVHGCSATFHIVSQKIVQDSEGEDSARSVDGCREKMCADQLQVGSHGLRTSAIENSREVYASDIHHSEMSRPLGELQMRWLIDRLHVLTGLWDTMHSIGTSPSTMA